MEFDIALVQFSPKRKNVTANILKVQELLGDIQADLIVLPELSNSGYLYEAAESLAPYSESKDGSGPFLAAMSQLATMSGSLIITGYAEIEQGQLYNSAAAITTVGVLQNYRKTHLFDLEKLLFQPGNTGFLTLTHHSVKIGMMICFDWIFPESARTLALSGAQIIAHPANLVMPYCQTAMVTRSIENKVFTITANRIGEEDLGENILAFTGASQITAPDGSVLYRGPTDKSAVHMECINPDEALDKAISPNNDLMKDRRSNMYNID